jgi:hypothetical protein
MMNLPVLIIKGRMELLCVNIKEFLSCVRNMAGI